MPLYSYYCKACDKRVDVLCKISERDNQVCSCVNNHGEDEQAKAKLERLLDTCSFGVNGIGAYDSSFKVKR